MTSLEIVLRDLDHHALPKTQHLAKILRTASAAELRLVQNAIRDLIPNSTSYDKGYANAIFSLTQDIASLLEEEEKRERVKTKYGVRSPKRELLLAIHAMPNFYDLVDFVKKDARVLEKHIKEFKDDGMVVVEQTESFSPTVKLSTLGLTILEGCNA